MDDSVYTKQCDHEKIRGLWEPKVGDKTDRGIIVELFGNLPEPTTANLIDGPLLRKNEPVCDLIWLPRQDQLQEMIRDGSVHFNLLAGFWRELTVYGCIKKYYIQFNSMEQLWLAFVMHELHGLRWDGAWKSE